jgi:hypothetical protein
VKLALHEAESAALIRWVASRQVTSSIVARVETVRAVRRSDVSKMAPIDDVFGVVAFQAFDDVVLSLATSLDPPTMRTLDAIHVASALRMRDDLNAFVTYDARQAEVASFAGLPVASPS